ncbi:hypothetical protein IMZ48_10640, partial [Candidatus Bathyarchaeota archaeon]|nr:hypothetical protein [Candidatus Bathyarchaeota archaeon]
CYAGIQPLVLVAAAIYFCIDVVLKKYLLLYVFVTKTESGGVFWRVLFNRFIFGMILSNLVYFLTCWVRGEGFSGGGATRIQAFAVIPLPFLVLAFKLYCARVFDDKMSFYSTRNVSKHPDEAAVGSKESKLRSERLASRFGHPALYKPLITPMVHQKAQNMLHVVYKGRLTDGREAGSSDMMSVSGYSDTYALDPMAKGRPGKAAGVPGFEFVSENHLDFEYYKSRPEFADEHGAGDIFGTPQDVMRPGTPGSAFGDSRPGTPGVTGPMRTFTPPVSSPFAPVPQAGYLQPSERQGGHMYSASNDSSSNLVRGAAPPSVTRPDSPASRNNSMDTTGRAPSPYGGGAPGGGPRGYSGLAQEERADPGQYDYFRGTKTTRRPGEGW